LRRILRQLQEEIPKHPTYRDDQVELIKVRGTHPTLATHINIEARMHPTLAPNAPR